MELWIKSQDKELLLKPICFEIDEEVKNTFLILTKVAQNYNDICVGLYKTKERALEVLDEIQNKLNESNNSYEDLVNKLKIFSETPIIKCDNNDNCNISLNIAMLKDMIIYEMPKE